MPSDNQPPARDDRCLADAPPPCFALRRPTFGERLHRWQAAALAASVWLYLAALIAVWLLLRFAGDRWWFGTVLLFSPRWLYAVPWPALVLVAALTRRRLLRPLTVAALVWIWPIAGLCLPWGRLVCPAGPALRVLTCNIDGSAVDRRRLMALVADAKADVVALQECPSDVVFDWPEDWQVRREGELLVASRFPLGEAEVSLRRHPPSRWPGVNGLRCTVVTPFGPVRFCCVHLRTPREGLDVTLDRQTVVSPTRAAALTADTADRRLESEELAAWIAGAAGPTIVAGDFNMPTQSAIYRDCWSQYVNAFSTTGFGFGYSKLTPLGKFSYGLRIDHVLTGGGMRPCRSWLGPVVGSDHLPVLADVAAGDGAAGAN